MPSLLTATALGCHIVVELVPKPLLVKLAWPRTPSASAPLLRLAWLAKRSTRLLSYSATKTLPLIGSTATPEGPFIVAFVVELVLEVKSAWPSTLTAAMPLLQTAAA